MAHAKHGVESPQWWKHLRDWKGVYWGRVRKAPVEEPEPPKMHKAAKPRKKFVVESKDTRPTHLMSVLWLTGWIQEGKYKTKKQAEQAIEALKKQAWRSRHEYKITEA